MTIRLFLLVVINRSLSVERRCPPGMPVWRCNRNLDRDTSCKPTNLAEDWGHHMYNMLVKSNAFHFTRLIFLVGYDVWSNFVVESESAQQGLPTSFAASILAPDGMEWFSPLDHERPQHRYRPVSRILIAARWRLYSQCMACLQARSSHWYNQMAELPELGIQPQSSTPSNASCCIVDFLSGCRQELEAAQKPARASEFLQPLLLEPPLPWS